MGSRPGRPGWIGVDLDKTSVVYDDFRGVTHIGAPIMPMIERMRYWLSKGIDVRIFTARANPASYEDPAKHQEVIKAVQAFTIEHLGVALPVTHEKDYDLEQHASIKKWRATKRRTIRFRVSPRLPGRLGCDLPRLCQDPQDGGGSNRLTAELTGAWASR